jgi:hypothetical protein
MDIIDIEVLDDHVVRLGFTDAVDRLGRHRGAGRAIEPQ